MDILGLIALAKSQNGGSGGGSNIELDTIKYAVAAEFNENTAYPSWSFVWRNGTFYYLSQGHSAGVTWENTPGKIDGRNLGAHLTSVMSGFSSINRDVTTHTNQIAAIAEEFDESKVHDVNTYVWHNGKLYRIDSAHAPGVTWENTVCTEVILADEMAIIAATASTAIAGLTTSVSNLEAEVEASVVTVTGTNPAITAQSNTRYVCGEVQSISITPPVNGICDVTFTSGSTAAVLTVPNTVKFPSWFDVTTLETNTIYEINISDGLAVVMSWAS